MEFERSTVGIGAFVLFLAGAGGLVTGAIFAETTGSGPSPTVSATPQSTVEPSMLGSTPTPEGGAVTPATTTVTPRVTPNSQNFSEYTADFRNRSGEVISTQRLEASEGGVADLEYESQNPYNQSRFEHEIAYTAGAFAREVGEGWEVRKLSVTVYDSDSPVAVWEVQVKWAEQLAEGKLTFGEYEYKVLKTTEVLDDSEDSS